MSLYDSAKGRRLVKRLINNGHFDLVYADHLHMAQYVPAETHALTLLDQHNVETVILRRFADTQTHKLLRLFAYLELAKMSRYEPEMCRRFDAIWATTEIDQELISPWLAPQQYIEALPIGVDTQFFQPQKSKRGPYTIISVGTLSWPANVDGVLWFYDEIYSLLKKQLPDIKFVIVGANPTPTVQQLDGDPSVEVTGWVKDIRPFMARSTIMVVPMRGGSGMRVKILNALAMGLPVISTSVGCEGIDVTPGENILIANDTEAFVQQIITLFKDRSLQQKLSCNGIKLIQDKYSWHAVENQIEASLTTISTTVIESR